MAGGSLVTGGQGCGGGRRGEEAVGGGGGRGGGRGGDCWGRRRCLMFADPTFWVAVSFVLFVVLVARAVWRKATAALDARADEIRRRLEEAQNLREDAQAAKANYQRLQRDALNEAEAILAHARDEAKRMREEAAVKMEDRKNAV